LPRKVLAISLEHFPLLSSEYFVELKHIYYSNISEQDRSLEHQAGGNNGAYAVIGAMDWTCRKMKIGVKRIFGVYCR
jgi:hypothetical protein